MRQNGFKVVFPQDRNALEQDQEYCILVKDDGDTRRIRFHDYNQIYEVPGLYEHLFYERLSCQSPDLVSRLLEEQVEKSKESMSDLKVLELGAGNGMVGEVLKNKGVNHLVGVDILPEAKMAAGRDRPEIYREYFVEDMTAPQPAVWKNLLKNSFSCLVCVAALGFGDIPPEAFKNAYNLVQDGGWVAFNIKSTFVDQHDQTGFGRLIQEITSNGTLEIRSRTIYPHRKSIDGRPLEYVAVVGTKKQSINT